MKIAKQGFTLVEIMIVVAIIMTILVIAVPGYLRSRVIANETSAIAGMRSINSACQLYNINHTTYPESLSSLVEPASSPPYIDSDLASGRKQGYEYIYELVDQDHFTLHANPLSTGLLKGRYFYMDESGAVRANSEEIAGENDEIIG